MNLNFQLLIIALFDFFHEDENIEKKLFLFCKIGNYHLSENK